jgi:MFS transporter, SHS family, sialic acid transporter
MTPARSAHSASSLRPLSSSAQFTVLAAVLLGWMFAGVEMSLLVAAARPAIQEFSARAASELPLSELNVEVRADQWFSWYITAFLLGAAAGGALFGWLGDRVGRVKAMGASILCYSVVTGLSYFVTTPHQLLVLRFLACLGVGGMWPTGVALVSEAWPDVSRPTLAGLIGCAANVGFLVLGLIMLWQPVTPETWRWVLLFGGSPVLLGLWVLRYVPESPQWLQQQELAAWRPTSPLREVFRPPLLRHTLLGIVLGTVPLLGGWASGQRLVPWAGQVGQALEMPSLKALTQIVWAFGAVLGSLAGGWIASRIGRRFSYFVISGSSLAISLGIFLRLTPDHPLFPWAVFLLGLVSTSFFGWLPYFLPELFPTQVRATGAGVSYNFGRILSAGAVLSTTWLSATFAGDIARMGAATSLIYALGMVVIWFVPGRRAP